MCLRFFLLCSHLKKKTSLFIVSSPKLLAHTVSFKWYFRHAYQISRHFKWQISFILSEATSVLLGFMKKHARSEFYPNFHMLFFCFFFHYFSRRSLFGLISLYVWKIIFVFFLSSTLNIFECCTQHLVYTDNCPNILFYRTVLPKQKKKNYICKT